MKIVSCLAIVPMMIMIYIVVVVCCCVLCVLLLQSFMWPHNQVLSWASISMSISIYLSIYRSISIDIYIDRSMMMMALTSHIIDRSFVDIEVDLAIGYMDHRYSFWRWHCAHCPVSFLESPCTELTRGSPSSAHGDRGSNGRQDDIITCVACRAVAITTSRGCGGNTIQSGRFPLYGCLYRIQHQDKGHRRWTMSSTRWSWLVYTIQNAR